MAYFLIISLCLIFLFAGLILLGAFLPSETVGRFERIFSGKQDQSRTDKTPEATTRNDD